MKIKITSIVFLLIFCNIFSQKIEKVEPPFWWEGFKDNNLQLLLYGQDIGDLAPSISTNLVELVSFQKAENDNYLFINLKVNENGNYGDFKINLGNNKIKYSILKKNLDSQTHQGFDTTDVLCLITPDRFINGDYSNDNQIGRAHV